MYEHLAMHTFTAHITATSYMHLSNDTTSTRWIHLTRPYSKRAMLKGWQVLQTAGIRRVQRHAHTCKCLGSTP